MDEYNHKHGVQSASEAVIAYANYASFARNQTICNRVVESRMSLWCKEGCGTVMVNGARFVFHPGDYLFLPWGHRIEYQADNQKPFLLAGIHMIPQHDRDKPVEFSVAHFIESPLANCPWRRDADLAPLQDAVSFRLTEDSPLWLLSEYIVRLFSTHDWNEHRMRELAGNLFSELVRTYLRQPRTDNLRSEADFAALTEYLHKHLALPQTVADLAKCIHCSESTVGRLIRSHSGMSAVNWMNKTRIHRARSLLCTTRLSVSEVGSTVGVPDLFYFSKLFKKWTGESPLAYRKHTPML
jgi:AraC-like DNA-binding protein